MSFENKQRVIGIVVLIAFIALLIPFLFTSGIKKKQAAKDEIPLSDKKRELIAQQIQSINDTVPQEQPTQELEPTEQPIALPQDQLEPTTNSTLADEQVASALPIVLPETSAEKNEGHVQAESAAPVVKTPELTQAVKKSPVTATKKSTESSRPHSKEFWSVQVGSFVDQERVQKLISKLHAQGYHVYMQKVTTSDDKILTRILVGREASKNQAENIVQQLATTMNIKGYVVRNKQ